jgi:hypothetical protein
MVTSFLFRTNSEEPVSFTSGVFFIIFAVVVAALLFAEVGFQFRLGSSAGY